VGSYTQKALVDFDRYTSINGEFLQAAAENILITYYTMGKTDNAVQIAQDNGLKNFEAGIYAKEGNNEKALVIYEEILQEEIKQYKEQAQTDYKNEPGEHAAYMRKRASLGEVDGQTYVPIANTLAKLGRDQEALAYYEKSIQIQAEYEEVYDRTINFSYMNRGDYYLYKGNYQRAIDEYNRVLTQDNYEWSPHTARATAYIKMGELSKALEDINFNLTQGNENDIEYKTLKAYIYKLQNNTSLYEQEAKEIDELKKEEVRRDKDLIIAIDQGKLIRAHKFFDSYAEFLGIEE